MPSADSPPKGAKLHTTTLDALITMHFHFHPSGHNASTRGRSVPGANKIHTIAMCSRRFLWWVRYMR